MEQLRPGDTLLVHSIDRLCRNMSDMWLSQHGFATRALLLFF
ncbi:recombinase family protein [Yersinia enterocolitica]